MPNVAVAQYNEERKGMFVLQMPEDETSTASVVEPAEPLRRKARADSWWDTVSGPAVFFYGRLCGEESIGQLAPYVVRADEGKGLWEQVSDSLRIYTGDYGNIASLLNLSTAVLGETSDTGVGVTEYVQGIADMAPLVGQPILDVRVRMEPVERQNIKLRITEDTRPKPKFADLDW